MGIILTPPGETSFALADDRGQIVRVSFAPRSSLALELMSVYRADGIPGADGADGLQGPPGTGGNASAPVIFSFGDVASRMALAVPDRIAVFGVQVHIETSFNGIGATLAIGTLASPSLLVAADQLDLGIAAEFDIGPNETLQAGEDVWLTFTSGTGATQGAGWIVLQFVLQS